MYHVQAQHLPWSGLPAHKKAYNSQLDEVVISLKLDTLSHYRPGEMKERQTDIFYLDSADLYGFGYRDNNGVPYGVWKYFTRSAHGYELYCEGYFTLLKPEYLFADPEIEKDFALASDEEHRKGFISELPDRMLFTGEWRFYDKGRIKKIVVLENHVLMPYDRVGIMEGREMKNESLVQPILPRRKAGEISMASYFSPAGFIERIQTRNALLEFNKEGKPVIRPLTDLDFPVE